MTHLDSSCVRHQNQPPCEKSEEELVNAYRVSLQEI